MRRFRTSKDRQLQHHLVNVGFQYLPEELIQEVLHCLHWPTDFYNLSLVCRVLNRHATHELYSTLIVAYHRPERISALLSLLGRRHDLASLVTTLVFDEDVKSIGPQLPDPGKWPPRAHRRELADGWDPTNPDLQSKDNYPFNRQHETIAKQLNTVLIALPNIQRVIMRSLHPYYMDLGLCQVDTDRNINTNFESSFNSNLWECIFKGSPLITDLYLNGVTNQMPRNAILLNLTTICISDLYFNVPGHAQQARTWNTVLAQATSLHTLGMIHVEHAHVILHQRFFPRLEALEFYKVFLGVPQEPDSQIFVDFLTRHSPTLRVLALSSHLWWSIDHSHWLRNATILPNLYTLRLDNIFSLLGSPDTSMTNGNDQTVPQSDGLATQREKTNIIIGFIARRPTILDVGISGLSLPEADEFARLLAASRPMRNIFIGSRASESFRTEISYTRRYWGYSYEAWVFYKLFEGLALSKSGFRPWLPPRPWKFWKKSPS